MTPKFPELAKVRTPDSPPMEGFIIESRFRDGRWLYKVSLPNPDAPGETFDNWYAEASLMRLG